jgi:hypothetical protein
LVLHKTTRNVFVNQHWLLDFIAIIFSTIIGQTSELLRLSGVLERVNSESVRPPISVARRYLSPGDKTADFDLWQNHANIFSEETMNQTRSLSWFSFQDFLARSRLPAALSNSHVRLVVWGGQKRCILCAPALERGTESSVTTRYAEWGYWILTATPLYLAFEQYRVAGSPWRIERGRHSACHLCSCIIKQVREGTWLLAVFIFAKSTRGASLSSLTIEL